MPARPSETEYKTLHRKPDGSITLTQNYLMLVRSKSLPPRISRVG
jgi:hypothetical protein